MVYQSQFGDNYSCVLFCLRLLLCMSGYPLLPVLGFVNANFNLNIFQRLKLSTDNLSGMTDQVILNLSLDQLARLGEAKEFKSNMLKKQ